MPGPRPLPTTEGHESYYYSDPEITRPGMYLADGDLRTRTLQARAALIIGNRLAPVVFRHGDRLVRLRHDTKRPYLESMSKAVLRNRLAEVADWLIDTRAGIERTAPPMQMVENLLAEAGWEGIPQLDRLVRVPVIGVDGNVLTHPGYHPASRVYYSPAPRLRVAPVPQRPTLSQMAEAKQWLLDELLADFPFVGEADKANIVAALLLTFVRDLIDGPTPLHLVEAPVPGTGKGLLVEMISYVALGRMPAVETQGDSKGEWRKKIGAALAAGEGVVFLDNLSGKIDDPSLAAVLTADEWADRRLGHNDEFIRYVNRTTWTATANNLTLSKELARRTVPIRLDAGVEAPADRGPEQFRHHPLHRWVKDHHSELVHAALTLISGWLAAGCPDGHENMGAFEDYAAVMAGILGVAEVAGFLGNVAEFKLRADTETQGWTAFVLAWWRKHQDHPVGASQLLPLLEGQPDFLDLGRKGDQSRITTLGFRLKEKEDAVFSGYRIAAARDQQGSHRWRLTRTREPIVVT